MSTPSETAPLVLLSPVPVTVILPLLEVIEAFPSRITAQLEDIPLASPYSMKANNNALYSLKSFE